MNDFHHTVHSPPDCKRVLPQCGQARPEQQSHLAHLGRQTVPVARQRRHVSSCLALPYECLLHRSEDSLVTCSSPIKARLTQS